MLIDAESAAADQAHWLSSYILAVAHAVQFVGPRAFALATVALSGLLALSLITGVLLRAFSWVGVAYSLFLWSTLEAMGAPYKQGATDPGSGIVYAIGFLLMLLARPWENLSLVSPRRALNPYLDPLSGRAAWNFDRTAFDVQPDIITIHIPPKGVNTFEFTLKALQAPVSPQSLPRLDFRLVSERRHYVFQREILFLNRLEAPFRSRPPVLDGKLEDWAGVPLLQLPTGVPSVPEVKVRAFHDGEDFYIAVTAPTPPRVEAADPYFRDDLQVGMNERINDTEFGPDKVRLGFTRAGSAVEAKDRTPGHKTGDVLPGVRGGCLADRDSTTYEIAIPAALLKHVKAKEAGRFVLDLSYFIPEGESGGLAAVEPRPNSFSYQVRFGGGNALSPVHFIELLLEPPTQ